MTSQVFFKKTLIIFWTLQHLKVLITPLLFVAIPYLSLGNQDSIKFNTKKSFEFANLKKDSALIFSDRAIFFAKQEHDTVLAVTLHNRVRVLIMINKLNQASVTEQEALNIFLTHQNMSHNVAKAYVNLGIIQYYQANHNLALEHFLKAERTIDKKNQSELYQSLIANLAAVHVQLKNYEEGKKYLLEAVDMIKEESISKVPLLTNLTAIFLALKDYKKLLKWAKYAEKLAIKFEYAAALPIIYNNLLEMHNNKGDLDSAQHYANLGDSVRAKYNLAISGNAANNLGKLYYLKGQYEKSIVLLRKALRESSKIEQLEVLKNLTLWNIKNNQQDSALMYFDQYFLLSDSINKKDLEKKVESINALYKVEKSQQETKIAKIELSQQKYNTTIIIGVFSLLSIIAIAIYFQKVSKDKLTKANTRYKLLTLQLNPHFIFHVLQSIQYFLHKNDVKKSSKYLASFSSLMRFVLEKTEEELIAVCEDFDALNKYLELQQLNYNNRFTYNCQIDNALKDVQSFIPVMLTKPYVENAVIHGVAARDNGKILVSYSLENDQIIIRITDNGKGIGSAKSNESGKMHKSMGTKIISEMLDHLSKKYKKKFSVKKEPANIDNEYPGTTIILQVPILNPTK